MRYWSNNTANDKDPDNNSLVSGFFLNEFNYSQESFNEYEHFNHSQESFNEHEQSNCFEENFDKPEQSSSQNSSIIVDLENEMIMMNLNKKYA